MKHTHWIDCDCKSHRRKCSLHPDVIPPGYRWDGGIWEASFLRVGDLFLWQEQAAIVTRYEEGMLSDTLHARFCDGDGIEDALSFGSTTILWTLEKVSN